MDIITLDKDIAVTNFVDNMVREADWSYKFAYRQALLVVIGVRDARLHDNCISLITDLEAIEAATANGPDTLGPQAPLSGQLREGYDADVIALDTNPLDDRSVWGDATRVTHVWQAGQRSK
ncbi:MAG: hypothetical protein DRJ50_07975 [Actinobacteria bacterium]|nr:MAG: hypothetical protein DRJ50_07975 [Actinomycetota bacterium]